jgi:hypothetical protein
VRCDVINETYLCCSCCNKQFMCEGNCVRLSICELSSVVNGGHVCAVCGCRVTHDHVRQRLVRDNLPPSHQRIPHALQPLLSRHFQGVDANGAVAGGAGQRAPEDGKRVSKCRRGGGLQQRLISVRSRPKTRAKAASASAERMETGGTAAKGGGMLAVGVQASCWRISDDGVGRAVGIDMLSSVVFQFARRQAFVLDTLTGTSTACSCV